MRQFIISEEAVLKCDTDSILIYHDDNVNRHITIYCGKISVINTKRRPKNWSALNLKLKYLFNLPV
jgi:hypothetical protein